MMRFRVDDAATGSSMLYRTMLEAERERQGAGGAGGEGKGREISKRFK